MGPLYEQYREQLNINLADFSLNLMRDVGLNSSNLFCSPLSITFALAMTLAGTRANTKKQLKSVVFGDENMNDDVLHASFGKILNDTLALPTSQPDTNGQNKAELLRLHIANQLFPSQMVMNDRGFCRSFMNRMRMTYKVAESLLILDYSDPVKSAKVINDWVSEKTNGKIKDIVSAQSLDSSTAAVLVNAIYFKSPWQKRFQPRMTSNEKFYRDENDVGTPVKMMKLKANFPYYSDPHGNFSLSLLPYANPNYNMFVILPTAKDGVNEVLKSLRGKELLDAISQAQSEKLNLWLPKFKFDSKFALKPTLAGMGVTDMFLQKADFSWMTPAKFHVSEVLHKAVVEVNEEGTEAAAATAVVGMLSAAPGQVELIVDFKVDHPFLFGIWEKSRNQIYFLGKLSNPV